jgi:orotate phosphoribosyltransferase
MTEHNTVLFPVEFRELRTRLFRLIQRCSYEWREEPFQLKSGAMSNTYVDCSETSLRSEGAYLIGRLFVHLAVTYAPKARGVGGLAMGADPIVTAVTNAAHFSSLSLIRDGYLVRGAEKDHGKGGLVIGPKHLGPKEEVIVVDDVITSGGSMLQTVSALRLERDFIVNLAMALVDREEQDGVDNIAKEVSSVIALFTLSELKSGQPDHVRFMNC